MKASFRQRFGTDPVAPIDKDFPETARIALMYLLQQLVSDSLIIVGENGERWASVLLELRRIQRTDFRSPSGTAKQLSEQCHEVLMAMDWTQVYTFCERIHDVLLTESSYQDYDNEMILVATLDQARQRYTEELNTLLCEENIAFDFEDGQFRRPGRPQTQKNIARTSAILADPKLHVAKGHFQKAYQFFSDLKPDSANAVKEALCSLEAAVDAKSGQKVSADFAREVKKLSGKEYGKIPSPIAEAMIKLQAYRGAGSGVTHGTADGFEVTQVEAEFILSATAAMVTYIAEFYDRLEDDLPF